MTDYRIYTLDDRGHIAGPPDNVECSDDQEAVQKARQSIDGHDIEVWQGNRFITRILHKKK